MLMSSVSQNPVGMVFFCPTISGPSEMKIYAGSNSGGPDCHPKAPSLTCVGSGWTGLEAGLSGPITWCLHVPESCPGLSHPGSCIPGGVSPGHVKRARKKLVAYCDQAPDITVTPTMFYKIKLSPAGQVQVMWTPSAHGLSSDRRASPAPPSGEAPCALL